MTYFDFFKKHPAESFFGMTQPFVGAIGQTFLISLFVPHIMEHYRFDNTTFGSLYATVTLTSSFLFPFFGSLLDKVDLKKYTTVNYAAMALGCILLYFNPHISLLFLGLLLTRMCGQSAAPITAQTVISKLFIRIRGKALAIINLGFPLSHALLPPLVGFLIAKFNWNLAYLIYGLGIVFLVIPLNLFFIHKMKDPHLEAEDEPHVVQFTHKEAIRHKSFYFLVPMSILPAFVLTGLFFYQKDVAALKGWDMKLLAQSFVAFAVFQLIASFCIGPLIDKYGSKIFVPFYLIPLSLGILVLIFFNHPLAAYFYLGFCGISIGIGGNLKSALWAEIYGTKHLGAIRSIITPLMVTSTAICPALLGIIIDHGINFIWILYALLAIIVFFSILSAFTPYPT